MCVMMIGTFCRYKYEKLCTNLYGTELTGVPVAAVKLRHHTFPVGPRDLESRSWESKRGVIIP